MACDLLIDARNLLYRAIYAGKAENTEYHYFTIFVRQLNRLCNLYSPTSIHMFWDTPRENAWRRQVLPTYKDRSTSQYVADISDDLKVTTDVAKEFFDVMNIRQYGRDGMEADDLIYAAATILHPKRMIIVSSDSDLIQIPYNFSSAKQYDPSKKEEITMPVVNPVLQKSLIGDKSDKIDGYYGIGPKKSEALLLNENELQNFIKSKGSSTFYRNLLLIDLSLCPRLLHNKVYVLRQLAKQPVFCKDSINSLIMTHKVNGLLQEFNSLILPFQRLNSLTSSV